MFRNTPLVLAPAGPNSRRHGRVRCTRLGCYFLDRENAPGTVLDLSVSGMRVWAERNPKMEQGDLVRLLVVSTHGQTELVARVVWAKRKGFRRFELGLTFGEPDEELRRRLNTLLRAGANTYIVYDAGET